MERFVSLRTEVMRAIGYDRLKRAYELLDRFEEEEIKPKMVELLGGEDQYFELGGKIWQLKFYEESLYAANA